MIFHRLTQRELSAYTYVIGNDATLSCTVIDPTYDIDPILKLIETKGLKIKIIMETHVHTDFVSGALKLKEALGGVPKIICSAMGGEDWIPPYADIKLKNGDSIELDPFRFQALYTPGHTPEHLIYKIFCDENFMGLFTGDFILAGGVGRPDLLGDGETETLARELYQSLFETIKSLPDELPLFPAHGPGSLCSKTSSYTPETTLGDERENNPAFKKKPIYDWIEDLLQEMPYPSIGFKRVKEINRTGKIIIAGEPFLIDTRDPLSFSKGHNKGAVNIPWCLTFLNWVEMITPNAPIQIYVPQEVDFNHAKNLLSIVGLTDVTPLTLKMEEETPILTDISDCDLIDVRTEIEWNQKHLAQAKRIELAALPDSLSELSKTKPLALLCESGMRSMIAASYLQRMGFQAGSVKGGMRYAASITPP